MKGPNTGEITWLVKKVDKELNVIGFILDHNSSFFVVGSPTGSYYGGHNEAWKDKWGDFLREGYVLSNEAIKHNLIPKNWTPPKINKQDNLIVAKILKGIL